MKNYWLDKIPAGKFSEVQDAGCNCHEKFFCVDGVTKILEALLEKYKYDDEVINAINFLQATLEKKGQVLPYRTETCKGQVLPHSEVTCISRTPTVTGSILPYPPDSISHYVPSTVTITSSACYCCSSSSSSMSLSPSGSSSSSSSSASYDIGIDPAENVAADLVQWAGDDTNLDIFYPNNPIKDDNLEVTWFRGISADENIGRSDYIATYTPVIPATMKGTIVCAEGEFNFAFDENGKWSTYRDGHWWVGSLNHQTGILTLSWHSDDVPKIIANYEYGKEL